MAASSDSIHDDDSSAPQVLPPAPAPPSRPLFPMTPPQLIGAVRICPWCSVVQDFAAPFCFLEWEPKGATHVMCPPCATQAMQELHMGMLDILSHWRSLRLQHRRDLYAREGLTDMVLPFRHPHRTRNRRPQHA